MINFDKTSPSLVKKLNIVVFSFLIFSVTLLTGFTAYQFKNNLLEEREIILNSIGEMTVTALERPFSLGDYSDAESRLAIEKLPPYITSIRVLDLNGVERAFDSRENTLKCEKSQELKFPLLDGEVQSGSVIVQASSCDLDERFNDLFNIMLTLAMFIIVVGVYFGKKILIWAWRPMENVLERATSSENLTDDILTAAPKELVPIIKKVMDSYKSISAAELLDEMLHNLASPVKTLKQIFMKYEGRELSHKDYKVVLSNISQIESYIKAQYEGQSAKKNDVTFVNDLLESTTHGKLLEISNKNKDISIIFNSEESDYGLFSSIEYTKLKDIISNMMNNSYDAILDSGVIRLQVNEEDEFLRILVEDNGKGIAESDIKAIFDKGISLKESSGLGLHYAQKTLEEIGGSITVSSRLGRGTSFTIKLPKVPVPKWFKSQVDITDVKTIVVVDDEIINYNEWASRKELGVTPQLIYSESRESLEALLPALEDLSSTLFIVDYEFKGQPYNGADLIREFELKSAFISTNKIRSPEVYEKCKTLNIKILPKPLVSKVPIRTNRKSNELQAVFLDDDNLIDYLVDSLKKNHGIESKAYYDYKVFLKESKNLPIDTLFFIDKKLDGISGVEVARTLRSNGFYNLVAATGSTKKSFSLEDRDQFLGYINKMADANEYADIIQRNVKAHW